MDVVSNEMQVFACVLSTKFERFCFLEFSMMYIVYNKPSQSCLDFVLRMIVIIVVSVGCTRTVCYGHGLRDC